MKGVTLILGPERFLAREHVARVLARDPGQEVVRYDGPAVKAGQVLDDVRTPTLLGEPRTVVVDNAGELLREALAGFTAYAKRPVKGARLILVASGLDGRLKGVKELKAAAEVLECQPLREWKVAEWIEDRARGAHGLRVGREAAEALRRRIGEDLGLLDAALARLREQISPRDVLRPEDVEGSTAQQRSPTLFEPANALEAGDLRAALHALAAAFQDGVRIRQDVVTDPGAVAPILLDHLHQAYVRLLRFHLHRGAGVSDEEAARRAGCSPQQANFFVKRARVHRMETLVARHRHFVEADLALKQRGAADGRQVLEHLLLRLLAPGA